MDIVAICGSTSISSCNEKLLRNAADYMILQSHSINYQLLSEMDVPPYCQQNFEQNGLPPACHNLASLLTRCDAVIICTPEYNYSFPGNLKNLIDWVSRVSPNPWTGVPLMLMSASPSKFGGRRGLSQLEVPMRGMDCLVFEKQYCLPNAYGEFSLSSNMTNIDNYDRLGRVLSEFELFIASTQPTAKVA